MTTSQSPDASNISITLEEHLRVGSVIKAVTIHGEVYEGEVMAVDSKTRLAFLAVPVASPVTQNGGSVGGVKSSTGSGVGANSSSTAAVAADSTNSSILNGGGALSKSSRINVVMLNLNMLQDLVAVRGPPEASQVPTLAPVSIHEVEQSMKMNVAKKMKRVQSVGVNVPPVAQALFDKLKCQYNNCSWIGPKILVEDVKVTIGDIKEPVNGGKYEFPSVDGEKDSSVQHVKNLIEQFWPQCIQQQQLTTDSGGGGGVAVNKNS